MCCPWCILPQIHPSARAAARIAAPLNTHFLAIETRNGQTLLKLFEIPSSTPKSRSKSVYIDFECMERYFMNGLEGRRALLAPLVALTQRATQPFTVSYFIQVLSPFSTVPFHFTNNSLGPIILIDNF